MIGDMQQRIDQYAQWLRDRTSLREVGDWTEITTPFLDRHNDFLQLYAKRRNGGYILSDDGYILQDLEQSGCSLTSPKRKELLSQTLNGFGVRMQDDALEVAASEETFPQRKHSLVQAMLAVNDLFYLATPFVASLFHEDVASWMTSSDIRFIENVKFTGKSGFDHLFEFVIPKFRQRPERIVKPITRPNRESAELFLYSWMDTRDARPSESTAYVMLNDVEQSVSATVLDAFSSYGVKPVVWSKREEVKEALAA